MRPMRWVGDVDQSEFEHACQSALSFNYPYDNDFCRQYEYDSCNIRVTIPTFIHG